VTKATKVQLVVMALTVPLAFKAFRESLVHLASAFREPPDRRDHQAFLARMEQRGIVVPPARGAPRVIPDRQVPWDRRDHPVYQEPMEQLALWDQPAPMEPLVRPARWQRNCSAPSIS